MVERQWQYSNMNVASLDPCLELCDLSNWGLQIAGPPTEYYYKKNLGRTEFQLVHWSDISDHPSLIQQMIRKGVASPAYDIGYVIRRLPVDIEKDGIVWRIRFSYGPDGRWYAGYKNRNRCLIFASSDTPENALVLLGSKLFKSAIIVKGEV